MPDSGLTPFRDFPEDLIRSIFESALEDPDDLNWECAMLSKAVQRWVEPLLYRQIVLNTTKRVSLLHRTVLDVTTSQSSRSMKARSFFQTHVKLFCMTTVDPDFWNLMFDIFLECSSAICNLYCHVLLNAAAARSVPKLRVGEHTVWERVHPKRLRIPELMFTPARRNFNQTVFKHVTHLDLYWRPTEDSNPWDWRSLSLLTALTHLCFSPSIPPESLPSASQSLRSAVPHFPPALIVCIFFIPYTQDLSDAYQHIEENGPRRLKDDRVVIAVDFRYWDEQSRIGLESVLEGEIIWRHSHNNSTEARKDNEGPLWDRAESVITKRRRIS
ncbi:hypothetical protein DFP72DRAFT_226175 [Ephemerocybe angulata]|uniref:Uncharacterized protein n=1 Tax=Ephemerocybe angulata TaxID=980116 RepID=A0A8H6H7P2_9AGAR|nr:hypothetical protein DFP72DRAFT_226175 [Tulosesus angulatus]